MASRKVDPAKVLTIIVGGDPDMYEERLFAHPEEWKTHPQNVFYVRTYEELHRWLSPAKIDLLIQIMTCTPEKPSIGEIAQKTKRKQEAISRDIHQLAKMKLIELEKKGKNVLAHSPFHSIQIQFAQKT
ncbi:MAG: hypothetical protein AABW68_01360 [archaeon]